MRANISLDKNFTIYVLDLSGWGEASTYFASDSFPTEEKIKEVINKNFCLEYGWDLILKDEDLHWYKLKRPDAGHIDVFISKFSHED